jgi:[acyl-carrier-protein] S-malonyltransferase
MAVAWVFPGQGSQKSGMADAVLSLPGASERFALASERLGRDLLAICSASEAGEGLLNLHDTRNTQPALFVVESLLVDALQAQGRRPDLVAGHSLGELVALYAAGVFDAETGLALGRGDDRRHRLRPPAASGAGGSHGRGGGGQRQQ